MATKKREISIKASDRSSRKKGRGKRTNERRERELPAAKKSMKARATYTE